MSLLQNIFAFKRNREDIEPFSRPSVFAVLRYFVVVLSLIFGALSLYGLGSGGSFYLYVAQDPFSPGVKPWYAESVLHVGLTHLLGFDKTHLQMQLFVLSFGISSVMFVGIIVWRRFSELWAYILMALLFFHPLLMILFTWSLHPDAVTVFCTAIIFFTNSYVAIFIFALFGAMNHASQMVIICTSAIVCRVLLENNYRFALTVGLGWLAGKGLLETYLGYHGIIIEKNRLQGLLDFDTDTFFDLFMQSPWWTLFTLHSVYWILLFGMLVYGFWLSKRAVIALVISQSLALVFGLITYDTTRVHAVLGWAGFTYCLLYLLQRLDTKPRVPRYLFYAIIAVSIIGSIAAPKKYKFYDIKGVEKHQNHFAEILRKYQIWEKIGLE